jgi:GNAT superfamily N-acetyltransferase
MRLDGDVALLAGAATLPAFRRRGVQRALLRARLADAARAGCARAIVVTQPGTTSQANAQRQGFHLLYARALLVQK